MLKTSECIVEFPPEELDFAKWQRLVNMMAKLFDAASGVVVQYRKEAFNVVATSDNDGNFLQVNSRWPWDMKSFCRRIVETNQMLYVNDPKASEQWCCVPPVSEGPVRSYLGYPIYWPDGSIFGSFCVIDTKPTDYATSLIEMLEQLKLIVESELKHVVDTQKIKSLLAEKVKNEAVLKQLALFDPLTQCANRNLLNERFDYRLNKSTRDDSAFHIAYIDLDQFKPINDQFGHNAGDKVLSTIADRLKQSVRAHDLVARIGGDEFVILFDDSIDSTHIKQKLAAIVKAPIEYNDIELVVSASIGLSRFPDDGGSLHLLLATADADMYSQKKKAVSS
jgi:diguanylate cyclase (GGDEF)-like protein